MTKDPYLLWLGHAQVLEITFLSCGCSLEQSIRRQDQLVAHKYGRYCIDTMALFLLGRVKVRIFICYYCQNSIDLIWSSKDCDDFCGLSKKNSLHSRGCTKSWNTGAIGVAAEREYQDGRWRHSLIRTTLQIGIRR